MAGSIDGLSSQLYNQINSASTNSSAGLESKLDGKDYSKASDEELMDVCREFESYFLEQMFKNMKKMVPKDDAESQYAQSLYDYYEESHYDHNYDYDVDAVQLRHQHLCTK